MDNLITTTATPVTPRPAEDPARPDTIAAWSTPRDRHVGTHLEALRDRVAAMRVDDDPEDHERSPSQARITVHGPGHYALQLMDRGTWGPEMRLSRRAATQLAGRVLPSRGLSFVDALAGRRAGHKLATMVWQNFHLGKTDPVLIRTVRRGAGRGVRAVLSQGYQLYDNLDMLNDVLEALGDQADLYRVIDWRIDTGAMRVRMVGGDEGALEAWRGREVDRPFPMTSLWNGEVGDSAVYVKAGTFTLWCSNGCGTWSKDGQWRWNHSGRDGRVRAGVASAIRESAEVGSGVVAAYEEALATEIDDAYAWFQAQIDEATLTQATQEQVRQTMLTEDTVHGNGRLLASVVDAVTYVAHEQSDIFEQDRMERLAGSLLNRGLGQAEGRRLRAPRVVAQAK